MKATKILKYAYLTAVVAVGVVLIIYVLITKQ